jgi:hypothetical protein
MKHTHLSMQDLNLIVITEMSRGKTRDDLVACLRERGWPENVARRFIANATSQKNYKDGVDKEAKRKAEQDDPFVIDDVKQNQQFAWLVAAIGLTMIAMRIIGTLVNIGH